MALGPRLHIVTGKGGVGKSTVCAALIRAALDAGASVLAVELSAPGGLSRILGARPTQPGLPIRVAPGLSLSFVDGRAALSEYLGRVLWPARLREAVLDHPLYRAFVSAAPGVGELMAMGKIRDELRQRDGLHHRYDYVVVDAGASGHALPHLRMAEAAQGTFTSRGRVRRESQKIEQLLCDASQTAIHVVMLPEHMPLREAEKILASLRAEPALPVKSLLVNRCMDPSPRGAEEALTRLAELDAGRPLDSAREALVLALRWRRGWERIQEEGIARFERTQRAELTRLPDVVPSDGGELGPAELDALARTVGRVCL